MATDNTDAFGNPDNRCIMRENDGCNNNCQVEAICGNNIIEQANSEECDDGKM